MSKNAVVIIRKIKLVMLRSPRGPTTRFLSLPGDMASHPNLFISNDGGKSVVAAGDEVVSVSGVKAPENKVKLLEQIMGHETIKDEIHLS